MSNKAGLLSARCQALPLNGLAAVAVNRLQHRAV